MHLEEADERLQETDPGERRVAIIALGYSGDPAAVGHLATMVADPDAGVRQQGASQTVRVPGPRLDRRRCDDGRRYAQSAFTGCRRKADRAGHVVQGGKVIIVARSEIFAVRAGKEHLVAMASATIAVISRPAAAPRPTIISETWQGASALLRR
jgi:hypothetical protein